MSTIGSRAVPRQRDAPDATLVDFDPSLAPALDPAITVLGLAAFHERTAPSSSDANGSWRTSSSGSPRTAFCRFSALRAAASRHWCLRTPAGAEERPVAGLDLVLLPSIVPGSHRLKNLAAVARRNGATLDIRPRPSALIRPSFEVAAQGQVSVLLIY